MLTLNRRMHQRVQKAIVFGRISDPRRGQYAMMHHHLAQQDRVKGE